MTMPVFFVSHGAPDLALADTPASRFLRQMAGALPRPKAALIVSAHWETQGVELSLSTDTIHDFSGFPRPLYDLRYGAPVPMDVVSRVEDLCRGAGIATVRRQDRGRDHGAWIPLLLAYGASALPTLQVSLTIGGGEKTLVELGRSLAPLREEGVLIAGSGGLTHNLRALNFRDRNAAPPPESLAFATWVDDALNRREGQSIQTWRTQAPFATQNHPTPEHFLPLVFAAGAAGNDAPHLLHDSWEFGALSMRAYRFGIVTP